MKKMLVLPLIISLSGSINAGHELQPLPGWQFLNTTTKALYARWYKTKIAGFFSKYAWGTKEELGNPVVLPPHATLFIPQPHITPTEGHKTAAELIVSHDPNLLTNTLDADNEGTFTDSLTAKSLFIINPSASPSIKDSPLVIFDQPAGTHKIEVVQDERSGWYFENKASQPIYARWYAIAWNKERKAYTHPQLLDEHNLISLAPSEKKFIPFPSDAPANTKLHLFLTFNSALLEKNVESDELNKLPQEVITRTRWDLASMNITWQIFKEQEMPTLVPFNHFIRIFNTTNHSVYCALYHTDAAGADKFGPSKLITKIDPHLSKIIHYPDKIRGKKVQLCVVRTDQKNLLKRARIAEEDMKLCTWKDFSSVNLFQWYLQGEFAIVVDVTQQNSLRVASLGGGAFERLLKKTHDIADLDGPMIEKFEHGFISKNPHYFPQQDISAHPIITKIELLTKEQEFVKNRSELARQAINKLFGHELIAHEQQIPKIALVFTGGGYRAMIETIGFLRGAAHTEGGNLFDCALYMSGLSGSTWALNPLVVSGLSPSEFSKEQRTKVGKNGILSLHTLISNLINKSSSYVERRFIESRYGQFHGPVGLYGHALAQALLDGYALNNKTVHTITLSDLQHQLTSGRYPLPISVAIDPGSREEERIWYEFTPYYIGTHQERGSWIETSLCGCIFKNGSILHQVPEYPLAHYLGIWGSAFAISPADIAKESAVLGLLFKGAYTISSGISKAYNYLLTSESRESAACGRFTAAEIPNFNYGYSAVLSGLRKKPTLCLIDGGITKEGEHRHNFASVPVLWRQADIIIMCDCLESPNSDKRNEHLLGSDEEAKRLRLPFPNLTRSTLHKKTLKHIEHETSSLIIENDAPIVVYMKAKKNTLYDAWLAKHCDDPAINRKGFDPDSSITKWTATSNFCYSPEQFDLLSGLTESIFLQSKENIKKAISLALERKGLVTS